MSDTTERVTILEPMPPERFDAFVAAVSASHAADSVAVGRWPEREALRLATEEIDRLLPQQAATPDHRIYEIKRGEGGPVLGFVWLGSMPRGTVRVGYVFQLFVYPEHRRRGHARAALLLVEQLTEALGLHGVALNVFGSNLGAQALYRSLGYTVTSLSMHKSLSARRPT